MILYSSLNAICTMRGPSMGPRSLTRYRLRSALPKYTRSVSFRSRTSSANSAKVIAADMDISPSLLSRKLNPSEGDTQRFNLDDLEAYLQATGDAPAVIEYLVAKYMDTADARKARALSKVEALAEQLSAAMLQLRGEA